MIGQGKTVDGEGHQSNIQTAKWCHRPAPAHRGAENYCEIPGHHLQPTQDANFTDCERKVSQGVGGLCNVSSGENNVSGMAGEQPFALLAPNLCSRALPQFGLCLFFSE